ncbi:MAG: hypothetical protein WA635_08760 [Gallionella sp.]
MSELRDAKCFLVGSMSVPSDTVEEAMGLAAEHLGDELSAVPDGEVGLRNYWVAGLGKLTFSRHPDLEEVDGDDVMQSPMGAMGAHRIKQGAGELDLSGYLPYAEAAVSSYAIFRDLKDRGELADDVRFHVAVPTPLAAVAPFFGDREQWPQAMDAWQRAITAEIERMVEAIPPQELAIQWDYCTEVCEICGAASGNRELNEIMPWYPRVSADAALSEWTSAGYLSPLTDGIPDEVRFGYHVCLGTHPQAPTVAVGDLSWVVRIANQLVANTPRRVDFMHLPAIKEAGRDFFAPLADLEIGETRPFLGVGHGDGTEEITRRGRAAQEFLPDFGISHYCGYGRDDSERIGELLRSLREGAELLATGGDAGTG